MGAQESVIGTGLTLGIVHVLTGPDHLSAIAALSANVGRCQAFSLGIRWGLGHSTGLLIVALILLTHSIRTRDEDTNDDEVIHVPENLTTIFESLVGVLMVFLGLYGLFRAWQLRRNPHLYNAAGLDEFDHGHLGLSHAFGHAHDHNTSESTGSDEEEAGEASSALEIESTPPNTQCACCHRCFSKLSAQFMALITGIIHGFAGPGGILGVLPAVQMHDRGLAVLYLGSFCTTSTLTMGIFAALYGTCSARIGNSTEQAYFLVQAGSALLALMVGIMWIVLVATGKLEEVFP